MLSELSGVELKGEYQLISMIRELAEKKKTYEKVEAALKSVEESGYGVILPEPVSYTHLDVYKRQLQKFVALIRSFFDQKGMHMQFNVVSRETLLDAQAHPENYKNLVVRVAGYSALFTTLSRSLQDDIINRTAQGF